MVASVGSIALISLLIGIIYLFFIRSFDIYEKDPWFKLFISFIIGGLLSIFFVSVIYQFFEVEYTMSHAIFRIGLPEEFAKLAAFYIVFWIFKREIDEPVDGVIYISAVALGFACIESISYALSSETPYAILFLRAFVSVIGHITFSGYMGIALFIHIKVKTNYTGILFALLIAALGHGLYDGLLFNPKLTFIFKYLYLAIILFHLYIIKVSLNFSWFRNRFNIDLFAASGIDQLSTCIQCKSTSNNHQSVFWRIETLVCNSCGSYIFSHHSFRMLMKYFRPVVRRGRFIRKLSKSKESDGLSLINQNSGLKYMHKNKTFSFTTEELTDWIRESYLNDRKRVLSRPVSGPILKLLGFRFLA
jgi:RsiW-degrading membrane proteinase PrsW (M82 family)